MSVLTQDTAAADPAKAATEPTTNAVQDPWFKDWVQSDGTLNSKSLERLPDHLKPLKDSWSRLRTIDDLGTTSVHAQTLIGKKALAPLPADAPDTAKAERKALLDGINGVPSSPKDYGISRPADLPESQWNQKLADNYSAWAHKYSVSPAAAKELMQVQVLAVKDQLANQASYVQTFFANEDKAFEATIKQQNIPAERAAALIQKGALAAGLDMASEKTKTFLKGADARLLAMRFALATGEDSAGIPGSESNRGGAGDPAELAKSAMKDPTNPLHGPYWNREGKYTRSDHDSAVEKVMEWLRQAEAKNPTQRRDRR